MIRILPALAVAAALAGCDAPPPDHLAIPGADPARGRTAIAAYGCGTCHVVPGIGGAAGRAGPSLAGWSTRTLVAGRVANTPRNLVAFLLNPQAIAPGSGMPAQGLSEGEARDVAAYLATLGAATARVRPPDSGLSPDAVARPVVIPGRGPFVPTHRAADG